MFYEPRNGHGLPHDPFKAIVAPRPIGWISTRSAAGAVNLAPYSFFSAISTHPYLICFSSEGEKDSVTFARETGEFTANLVSAGLFEAMNASSVDAPRGTSEFAYAGLTAVPGTSHLQVFAIPARRKCRQEIGGLTRLGIRDETAGHLAESRHLRLGRHKGGTAGKFRAIGNLFDCYRGRQPCRDGADGLRPTQRGQIRRCQCIPATSCCASN